MSIANSNHQDHAHHFNSAEHESESGIQGVWLFLCTEILMFGGLFVAYAIYKHIYPEMFHAGSKFLNWKLGALNTVVLLISSYTMAMAINKIQLNKQKEANPYFAITILCGLTFMVVKYFEYTAKIHHGLLPSKFFDNPDFMQQIGIHAPMYFGFYFTMTGLHGVHVLAGLVVIFWAWMRNLRGDFDSRHYTFVHGAGLFWHLVDLVWIYLFPLLYLVG